MAARIDPTLENIRATKEARTKQTVLDAYDLGVTVERL